MPKKKIVRAEKEPIIEYREDEPEPAEPEPNKVAVQNITNRHLKTTHYNKETNKITEISWSPNEIKGVLPFIAQELNTDYFKEGKHN